jgi:hypothetical protein
MMRRSVVLLSGGMKPYHEWHMHEPLLMQYEGWRILDNPKMTKFEAYVTDFAGTGRHIDPIIDDPRLTHKQRVCRLYRWALKEFINYFANANGYKFNLGYKVVRAKFEKYRYVTDPAMCDMMVRESQKYLREICNNAYFRRDPRSRDNVQCLTNPMFHPDNALCYDHWTPYEVQLYGDCKLHRYPYHSPHSAALPEFHERFGDAMEPRRWYRGLSMSLLFTSYFLTFLWALAFFHQDGWDDPHFDILRKHFNQETIQAMEMYERNHRSRYSQASTIAMDWDIVLGKVNQKTGYHWTGSDWDKHRVSVVRDPFYPKQDATIKATQAATH